MFSHLSGATCDLCDCASARTTQELYGQIRERSDVFQRWNKQRYIALGHRNNTKELQAAAHRLNHPP